MTQPADLSADYALAFETSSAWGGIAVGRGARVVEARTFSGPRKHATEFLPTLHALCRDHRIDPRVVRTVFVSIGPGSFTGLRIGVTAARMVAFAGDIRVVAVPTLEVIAHNALDAPSPPERVAVILDAKRNRVYAAAFERRERTYRCVHSAGEFDPAEFLARQPRDCAVLGEGVGYHRPVVEASGLAVLAEALWPPRAERVYALGHIRAVAGEFTDRRDLVPVYIRPPEAEEKFALRAELGKTGTRQI